jgi:hypothetical protein
MAGRKNMATRRQRAQHEQEHARKKQQRRYLFIGVGLVAAIVVIGLAMGLGGAFNPQAPKPVAEAALNGATCGDIQTFPTLSRDHIAPNQSHPPYSSNPPTSGWHWANPQDWGIYTTPQVQEQLVHNLEHGGIVVQYNNLSSTDTQHLTDLVQRDSYHMVLAPYPGLPDGVRVALTAWDHLQTCAGVDDNTIQGFTNAFRNKGPELVP